MDKYTNFSTFGYLINEPNAKIDMFNCQHIVLWGFNPAVSIMDTNTMYLLIQAKEQGIPITVIDHYVTRTSKLLGAKHLPLTGGTSGSALMTTSGKLEIYCQAMVEDYEARRWYNFDDNAARYNLTDADIELKHIGEVFRDGIAVEGIYTKSCDFTNNADDIPTTPNYDETFTLQKGTDA